MANLAAVVGIGQTKYTTRRLDVSIAGLVREAAVLAVQVNGKLRATLEVALSASRESVEALALAEARRNRPLRYAAVIGAAALVAIAIALFRL